jgi:hypothetical protein
VPFITELLATAPDLSLIWINQEKSLLRNLNPLPETVCFDAFLTLLSQDRFYLVWLDISKIPRKNAPEDRSTGAFKDFRGVY